MISHLAAVVLAATTATAHAPHTTVVKDKGSAKAVSLHVKDKVKITFGECSGSCGFGWHIIGHPSVAVRSTQAGQDQGSAGTHTFVLTATHKGTVRVPIGYFPPGADLKPTRVFTIIMKVS